MRKRLYEEIYSQLRQQILTDGKPGEHLPSESELSKRYMVSVVTLRQATLALERDGLVKRVSGVGVIICDRKKHGSIALVTSEVSVAIRPLYYHLRFSTLLQRNLLHSGLRAKLFLHLDAQPPADGLQDLREDIARGRCSEVVWIIDYAPEDFVEFASKYGVPVNDRSNRPMHVDYGAMISASVDFLAGKGCRRIGLISAPPGAYAGTLGGDAAVVFKEGLRRHRLKVNPGWIIQHSEPRLPGSGWQAFRDLWSASIERPDGLLVLDDVLYRDAVCAILEMGIDVPGELQIVTHSNRGEDFFHPFPVTLLQLDPEEMADRAARTIRSHIEQIPPPDPNIPFRLLPAPNVYFKRQRSVRELRS